MNQMKEKLKKNPIIVALYEFIFGKVHALPFVKHIKKHRTWYGNKNKDKKFFVITSSNTCVGMYSFVLYTVLLCIDYAVKNNYIPIVDLKKNHLPLIQDEDKKGLENAWEYYFEQPVKQYTLEEVYQSRHVITFIDYEVSGVKLQEWYEMIPAGEKDLKYWSRMIKSYIRLNSELKSRVEAEQKKIFKNHKILGVGIRAELRAGAMRGGELFNDHPKQPTCEELMDIVEEKMKDWKCDALFISSDDREYLNKFISRFGDKCLYMDRKLTHHFKNGVPVTRKSDLLIEFADSTVKERTEEYVVETQLLAQCHSLYSCIGGGVAFAYFLNGGEYEHCEVYNEGLYAGLENKDAKRENLMGLELEKES